MPVAYVQYKILDTDMKTVLYESDWVREGSHEETLTFMKCCKEWQKPGTYGYWDRKFI